MITSKPKQTAFRNKESIRCHWRKEENASGLTNSLGFFIRCKSIASLGKCKRAKKASERKTAGREKRRASKHLYKYHSLPTTPQTSK